MSPRVRRRWQVCVYGLCVSCHAFTLRRRPDDPQYAGLTYKQIRRRKRGLRQLTPQQEGGASARVDLSEWLQQHSALVVLAAVLLAIVCVIVGGVWVQRRR